ncbi:DUF3576 domain-containing protein [Magnetovibrio sp. PR-2]|uniref:DUF3576 domain-containing protein n=1 Tax=Magnetovibrio sp. PR-2 TaxID=3120356 RepID=UPI002FCE38D0
MTNQNFKRTLLLATICTLILGACEGGKVMTVRKNRAGEIGKQYEETNPRETIFGGESVFGNDSKSRGGSAGGALGVNTYLWRATLDTIAFMPMNSADPFGGVIITDWYSPPETPAERFKLNIIVLDKALRADGVRVSVFRQIYDQNGNWRDAPVDAETARQMEDAILTRARQLRNETRMQDHQ